MSARGRSWWVVLLLLPVLVIFGTCLANALAWIGRPFSGLLVLENGVVASIGRSEWTHMHYASVPFSHVSQINGRPVSGGRDVNAYVSATAVGKSINFRLRKGRESFNLGLIVRPFGVPDLVELFVPMLGVGLLIVLVGAAVAARRPDAPETRALFAVCASIGLTFITGPDEYSPYWFTPVFFLSLCAIAPAFVQLALAFPRRRRPSWPRLPVYAGLYLPFVALGAGLLWSMPEPSLFLPLLYTVYLFIANAVLLYVGGLILGLIDGMRPREPLILALAGVVGSLLVIVSILVAYPLLRLPISPAWLISPVLLLPVLEGVAFLRFGPRAATP